MIVNFTKDFIKLRKVDTTSIPIEMLTVDKLVEHIQMLEKQMEELRRLVNIKKLPTFKAKTKTDKEVNNKKEEIWNNIKQAYQIIHKISIKLGNERMKSTFCEYYNNFIENQVLKYNEQLINVTKAETRQLAAVAAFEEEREDISEKNISGKMGIITNTSMERTSIDYNVLNENLISIGSTLLELKLATRTQGMKLNSLDEYFDRANRFTENANKEIKKIHRGWLVNIKNRIIYFQIFFITLQLLTIGIKEYKNKHK